MMAFMPAVLEESKPNAYVCVALGLLQKSCCIV